MKRNPQPDFELISQVDWARLAAYIDGEGCICIADQVHKAPFDGRGRYGYAKVMIANTDARLTTWLMKNFGGSVQVRKTHESPVGRKRGWKPCFNWSLSNTRSALLLRNCLPYFVIKREQAEIAIAFQATMRRSGVKGTPQAILDQRAVLKTNLRALTARGPRRVVNE